jgi:ubiquinol-cytochrome c reductase cytochrome b/c1 subunit
MQPLSTYTPKSAAAKWLEKRLPVLSFMYNSFVSYPTPRNLNYGWVFGAILSVVLILQIITGVVLVMHYIPDASSAFVSVEQIMRDVRYGWLLRYLHANGASMFFFAMYIHIFRGLYYGSYKEPREVLWVIGVLLFVMVMATAFMGYVLPWGQMSFWGATVITSLFSAIPVVGESIVTWLWGAYSVSSPTLNHFFSLHYLLPFLVLGVVGLHVWALHVVGQNNPTGVEIQDVKTETVPFTPYATLKDSVGLAIFFLIFAWFVFFTPNYLGHPDNYLPADPAVTPAHIVPEWYFLPFYAILRAVPSKLGGVIVFFGAVAILAAVPWLDTSKVKSARYRPLFRLAFWGFVAVFILLGYLGSQSPDGIFLLASRICTVLYFGFFLGVLPLLKFIEKTKPLPMSVASTLKKDKEKKGLSSSLLGSIFLAGVMLSSPHSLASGNLEKPPMLPWTFSGVFGQFDPAQLQRGFKVYREVCASCHSLKLLPFRALSQKGGPEFSESQVKTLAASYSVLGEPDEKGEVNDRPALPSDMIPPPYPNDNAARAANNGALPPDFSLIAKAKSYERGFPNFLFDIFTLYQEQGPDYISALLTGYANPPSGIDIAPGQYYNRFMPGNLIAMPPPLTDGQVSYPQGEDGKPIVPETVDQYAKDVSAFLVWAAEPHMEERKKLGVKVFLFLLVFALLVLRIKRKVWATVKA